MFELATIKTFVDLFKDLVGLVEQRNRNKREAFERTCKPLYDRLEVVFKEYYALVSTTGRRLDETGPDFEAILREMREQRDALVIVRGRILGEAQALREHHVDREAIVNNTSFEQLVRTLASDILALFDRPPADYVIGHHDLMLSDSDLRRLMDSMSTMATNGRN